jgi:hypothetical protein
MRTLLVVLAIASPCLAQPAPGDWIVGDYQGGIYTVHPATGVLGTIAPRNEPYGWCLRLAPDNRDLLRAHHQHVLRVSPTGVQTTISFLSGLRRGLALHQDGGAVVAEQVTSSTASLVHVNLGSGALTTLTVLNDVSQIYDIVVDGDTGDWVVATRFVWGSFILRVRQNGSVTTLATLPTGDLEFEPATGSFLIAGSPVLRMARNGAITTVNELLAGVGVVHADRHGADFVLTGAVSSTPFVARMAPNGVVTTMHMLWAASLLQPSDIEIYGSHEVSGAGRFRAGEAYNLSFAFPGSPGAQYVAALSLRLRPGFALPDGRIVHLAADPLFFLSLGGIPGITTGFAGTLDPSGRASGAITLPAGFPVGVRIFVSAFAVNPARPSGLDTANSWGMTSQ